LYARDTVRQGLKPNDTLRILRQELKSGDSRQKINPVEAGDGRDQSCEIVDWGARCAHTKKVLLHQAGRRFGAIADGDSQDRFGSFAAT
jgi:hypothetical protein